MQPNQISHVIKPITLSANRATKSPPSITASPTYQKPSASNKGITGVLAKLEKRPLAQLVALDFFAFNVPKMTLTRTFSEFKDTATLELSNTAITLFASLGGPRMLQRFLAKITNVPKQLLKQELDGKSIKLPVKLARLGVSFGFFFPFASAFWAAPFFRNWLTLKRTQSANFESLIGFNDPNNQKKPKRTTEEEASYQKHKALTILGGGFGLGLLSSVTLGLLSRRAAAQSGGRMVNGLIKHLETNWKKPFNTFFNKFDLKGEGAYQIAGGPATLLFWGLPAYLGWIHAARSSNERRERSLQTANSLFWFFGMPILGKRLWHGRFLALGHDEKLWNPDFVKRLKKSDDVAQAEAKFRDKIVDLKYADIEQYFSKDPAHQETKAKLLSLKNQQYGVCSLGIPIVSLALLQLFNFRLTEYKIKKMMETNAMPMPDVQAANFNVTKDKNNTLSSGDWDVGISA